MSSSDPNDDARDESLRRALQSLPLPGTPGTVAGQVTRRLRAAAFSRGRGGSSSPPAWWCGGRGRAYPRR